MTTREYFIVSKEAVLQGLDKALADFKVAALTKKYDGRVIYDYISNSKEIQLKYKPTVLPPKKFFFPQQEAILEFNDDQQVVPKITANPQVLFGIKPCDLNAIKMMNEAFADDRGDPNYLAKLEKSIVIGVDCKEICDKRAFCYKVGTQDAQGGYDIMLYERGEEYTAETVTAKGKDFLVKYISTQQGSVEDVEKFRQIKAKAKAKAFCKEKPFKDLEKFPELFHNNKQHEIWNEEGSRCLSCGSCIMVCPTCYCFNVTDEWQLNLKKGERIRCWDACMLSSFATITSGENFRKTATARLHHRIDRKFNFLMKKHKMPVCVGCGRCVRACLADISPKTIAAAICGDDVAEARAAAEIKKGEAE